jgi:serine/threonine-protein kinase
MGYRRGASVYVADEGNTPRVVKLAAESSTHTELPFTDLFLAEGVAVDSAGSVYVADGRQVVKLAAGSSTQTVLPFTDLTHP